VDWVRGRLVYGRSLRSWIPDDFERYARVLHPAHVRKQAVDHISERSVPWSQISGWSGKPFDATSSIHDLSVRDDGMSWLRQGASLPMEGELERPLVDRLAEILAQATSTPGLLWLLVWYGYGTGVPLQARGRWWNRRRSRRRHRRPADDPRPLVDVSPSLTHSGRRYLLHRGSIETPSDRNDDWVFNNTPPSFWWPADRAWFVSTDIDWSSTYIAGSADLIDRLLDDRTLEVFVAEQGPFRSPDQIRTSVSGLKGRLKGIRVQPCGLGGMLESSL